MEESILSVQDYAYNGNPPPSRHYLRHHRPIFTLGPEMY